MSRLIGLALLALMVAMRPALGESVVRVIDGDSLVVESGGREVDVRLANVDAPELDQPRGVEARNALQSLVAGRDIELELVSGDAYRRIVARVLVGDLDVNAALVRQGFAWVRRAYSPAPGLIRMEEQAKAARRGLWADSDAVAPWLWRKTRRGSEQTTEVLTIPVVECGAKRNCGQMTSCEEALAHLQQCGLRRLDRDGDGIPCEQLCRCYR